MRSVCFNYSLGGFAVGLAAKAGIDRADRYSVADATSPATGLGLVI